MKDLIITSEQLKKLDKKTGLELEAELNTVVHIHTKRPKGNLRIQQDFQFCPTLTEQHTAHLTDINYLMAKYKPDELAAYLAARTQHRMEIVGHDFSREPSLQEGMDLIYQSKQEFEQLDPYVKSQFKSHLEFLKFIDNPENADKLVRMGIVKQKQIDAIRIEDTVSATTPTPTTTKEEEKAK